MHKMEGSSGMLILVIVVIAPVLVEGNSVGEAGNNSDHLRQLEGEKLQLHVRMLRCAGAKKLREQYNPHSQVNNSQNYRSPSARGGVEPRTFRNNNPRPMPGGQYSRPIITRTFQQNQRKEEQNGRGIPLQNRRQSANGQIENRPVVGHQSRPVTYQGRNSYLKPASHQNPAGLAERTLTESQQGSRLSLRGQNHHMLSNAQGRHDQVGTNQRGEWKPKQFREAHQSLPADQQNPSHFHRDPNSQSLPIPRDPRNKIARNQRIERKPKIFGGQHEGVYPRQRNWNSNPQ